MKKVAIIGTQGVPANYGGFETLVENIIGENCSNDIEYTVFCSSKDMPTKIAEHKGAKLKYIGFKANGDVYAGLIVPEPATATLSLLALAGLCARRRRASR